MQRKSLEECTQHFMIARSRGDWNDMLVWSTEIIKYKNAGPEIWANRGNALHRMGYHLDSILNYEKALELEHNKIAEAVIRCNIGAAYFDMWDCDSALPFLRSSLLLNPLPQVYLTMGNIYKYKGDLSSAIGLYREAIKLDPNYADGHLGLSMALLKSGQLEEGWKEYEWRFKTDQLPPRGLDIPQWKGEDLDNKLILVYGEQGLGDIIQFSRYVRALGQKYPKAKIIVEGRPPVHKLLNTINEAYAVISVGDQIPHVDCAIPMMTLAGMLTPSIESIPPSSNEFQLSNFSVNIWKKKFDDLKISRKRIGLCWAGMERAHQPGAAAIDAIRSCHLSDFAPLQYVSDILWVSLQKGPPKEQLKQLPWKMTIVDFMDEAWDFHDTACIIKNCDLVITVDTAVAHVAASIGVPTWLISRWDGCWRWFGDRMDSPWYPSLRQFVQKKPHDWKGVMEEVAIYLEDLTLAK